MDIMCLEVRLSLPFDNYVRVKSWTKSDSFQIKGKEFGSISKYLMREL
jgi:hypothetical protein